MLQILDRVKPLEFELPPIRVETPAAPPPDFIPKWAKPRFLDNWAALDRMTPQERARFAADVYRGRAEFPEWTVASLCRLTGANANYVWRLLADKPLPPKPPSLTEAWDRASPEERRALVREREEGVYQAI
jgi:transposase-like protein